MSEAIPFASHEEKGQNSPVNGRTTLTMQA
jgi:hypothetical protein